MLILSQAKIAVDRNGGVRVEGLLEPYAARITEFAAELGLRNATIRYRNRAYVFSRNIDDSTRQRLRNFLVNCCPIKNPDR
jgi:hypothetical protein